MNIRFALQDHGVEWKRGNIDAEIRICCPFCPERGESQDFRFRLGINVEKGLVHCFNCGYKRRSFKELAYRLELGEVDNAVDLVEGKATKRTIKLPIDFDPIDFKASGDDYWNVKARKYLLKRGVSRRQIERNGIGISMIGRYGYRVIFPVGINGKLDGFVARALLDTQQPRYLNTPGIKALYNVPAMKSRTRFNEVVLSEGIFKCFTLENFGNDGRREFDSGALLGHDLTEFQEDMLKERKYKVVTLWPDPDRVGIEGFMRIADKLSTRYRVKIPWPIPRKQADEMKLDEITRSFEGRRDFNEEVALRWQAEMLRV